MNALVERREGSVLVKSHRRAIAWAKKEFETREDEYTEILKLADVLEERKIPFHFQVSRFGFQIELCTSPIYKEKFSIIEKDGSCGCSIDMLEVWAPWDKEPTGPMTAHGVEVMIDEYLGLDKRRKLN